jgi:NADPH-dependent 2,4-dienoyl-CoA reductase/sulfur reductase-like enzyme
VKDGGGAERVLEASHILLAVGRRPNTEDLGLDTAGIAHERGWIKVNDRLRERAPGARGLHPPLAGGARHRARHDGGTHESRD